MVLLIHNNFAHRILNNSTVESTDFLDGKVNENNWGKFNFNDMALTGGQMMYVRKFLLEANSSLPLKPFQKQAVSNKPFLNQLGVMGAI